VVSTEKDARRFYEKYHSTFTVDEEAAHPKKDMRTNRRLVKSLGISPGAELLDLSCGQGLFLKAAAEQGVRVTGLDLSSVAIANTRRRVPQARLVVANAEKVPFKKESFDWVTCWGSLEHYAHPEKALGEIRRVLRPEGRAVVYVPNLFFLGYVFLVFRSGETPHEAGQNQFERFETRQGWEDMFQRQGFKVESVDKNNDMYGTQRMPKWAIGLYSFFVRPFIPLNLSYCFTFVLRKKR
jgi:SAM-dependent methyltransferase